MFQLAKTVSDDVHVVVYHTFQRLCVATLAPDWSGGLYSTVGKGYCTCTECWCVDSPAEACKARRNPFLVFIFGICFQAGFYMLGSGQGYTEVD